jgi:hypothetical protein
MSSSTRSTTFATDGDDFVIAAVGFAAVRGIACSGRSFADATKVYRHSHEIGNSIINNLVDRSERSDLAHADLGA